VLPDNLGYLFDTALAISPSNPAVFQGETVLTYADLRESNRDVRYPVFLLNFAAYPGYGARREP
jgi:hypothetical protein